VLTPTTRPKNYLVKETKYVLRDKLDEAKTVVRNKSRDVAKPIRGGNRLRYDLCPSG